MESWLHRVSFCSIHFAEHIHRAVNLMAAIIEKTYIFYVFYNKNFVENRREVLEDIFSVPILYDYFNNISHNSLSPFWEIFI